MQIRCGNCKGVHDSTAEVRACYQTPAVAKITDRQLSYLTDLTAHRVMPDNGPGISDLANLSKQEASVMIEQMLQQPVKPIGNGSIIPGDLPDGRYAFIEDNKPRFYRIATSKENGHRYIRKVLGGPGDFRYVKVTRAEAEHFIEQVKSDPQTHMMMFGYVVGVCGVCGSPLTDPESIELGIGPICAGKMGW